MNPQQYAIIDNATRVILRLTIDNPPQVLATETAIPMTSPISLNGFQTIGLDNKTILPANQSQIDRSGVDDNRNAFLRQQKLQSTQAAIDAVIADLTVPNSIRVYFQSLK